MGKRVRDAMTETAHTASPRDSLTDVARRMRDANIGSLPVVEDDRLVAVVTDRDIVVRGAAAQSDLSEMNVSEVASHDPLTVTPEDNLDDALTLMARYQVRRLPVVEDGRLVGVLAQADVAAVAKEKHVGQMLDDISQPRGVGRG
jgi:CBS domain-containing protein